MGTRDQRRLNFKFRVMVTRLNCKARVTCVLLIRGRFNCKTQNYGHLRLRVREIFRIKEQEAKGKILRGCAHVRTPKLPRITSFQSRKAAQKHDDDRNKLAETELFEKNFSKKYSSFLYPYVILTILVAPLFELERLAQRLGNMTSIFGVKIFAAVLPFEQGRLLSIYHIAVIK